MPLNYYRQGPADPKASPFIKKTKKTGRTRKFIVRILDVVVIIVILYGLVYSILVKSTPQISVNDTSYHPAADYKAAAAKQLRLLKNRNKISLDEQGISASLQKQFPEIAKATVELPLFSETPIVHLTVAKPSFFLANKGLNYVIDAEGVATSMASNLPQVKGLTTLNDQSGFSAAVGQQVLSAQSVGFIDNLLVQVARAKVSVSSLALPSQAQEVDLKTADRGYYVKFYLGGDPLVQTGQFLAARHQFDSTGAQPPQYLDVRIPGKVFYK